MNAFQILVGVILPILTFVVFVGGMGYRFYIWYKAPQPGKMTLFPASDATGGILAETFLFPSLFRGDKALWTISWLFHATLALVLVGHIRVFSGLIDSMLFGLGMSTEAVDTLSSTAGGAAGIVLLGTGSLLFARRIALDRVREISKAGDFIALFLIIATIATGDMMRFGAHFDLEQTRVWSASLLILSPVVPSNSVFLFHAMLAQLLIIYIPFSKILHFGGIFFSQALVKRR